MITKSIKAPTILGRLWEATFPGNRTPVNQQHHPHIQQPQAANHGWGKSRYDLFITEIGRHFKVGDLLAFAYTPPAAGTLPPYYRLQYLEELWYKVQFDLAIASPKCLHVENLEFKVGAAFTVAPSRMRHLTPEELELVNLKNSPPQGTA